jgi:hypothetical protein
LSQIAETYDIEDTETLRENADQYTGPISEGIDDDDSEETKT